MKNILIVLMLFNITISANTERGLQLKKMQEEQRVALVIGNTNYENLSKLKNPLNDARLMRATLKKRGFEVLYKENATKRDMKKLVKEFSHKLSRGGVGLYYFAGHGVNVDGKNFLVGINSLMEDKDEVEYETLALNFVTKKMKSAGNRLNIIILDACRNDPFSRSGSGGLAPVSNAKGIFIAYATEAGSVASDGKGGKNGIFTKFLVQNIKEEGATIERVFKNTRADVYDATNGTQSPGVYNQIRGDFFFTLASVKTSLTNKIKFKGLIYKTVKSPYTGKIWLDRNLGASSVCKSLDDKQCYGDYYQWGREADGHEKAHSETTSVLSSSTTPNHSKFIVATSNPYDWTVVDIRGSKRVSNWDICPSGYKVPTIEELSKETTRKGMKNRYKAFDNFLKLPSSGTHYYSGPMDSLGSIGRIWSSSHGHYPTCLYYHSRGARADIVNSTNGYPVRCMKE